MKIGKILVVAIIAIAMLAIPVSAGHGQVTVPNWEPFMFQDQATAMLMYNNFVTDTNNVYFIGNGVVAISPVDQFVISDDDSDADVEFYAVAGDWNGRNTISDFDYVITDSDDNTVTSGTMDLVSTSLFGMPFKVCGVDDEFTEPGDYTITVTVTDDGMQTCVGHVDFTIYDKPRYVVSDLTITEVTADGEVCGSFTVTNEYGATDATIDDVVYEAIVGDGMTIPYECITVDGYDGETFSQGESIVVGVCIDTTGYELAHGTGSFDIVPVILPNQYVTGQWSVVIDES